MATYARFEELPVWRAAARLYELCDDFLAHAPRRVSRSFRDQLERAVLSVSNNIAEGFERGTTNELLQFLYIARGSAGEVRSMLTVLVRRPWLAGDGTERGVGSSDLRSEISDLRSEKSGQTATGSDPKTEILNLIAQAESCSRQLRAWAESLQNSDIKGPRHLNEQTRRSYSNQQLSQRLVGQVRERFRREHPELFPAEDAGEEG